MFISDHLWFSLVNLFSSVNEALKYTVKDCDWITVCTWFCKKINNRTIFGSEKTLDLMTPIRWPHVPLKIATKLNSWQQALWVDEILWLSHTVNSLWLWTQTLSEWQTAWRTAQGFVETGWQSCWCDFAPFEVVPVHPKWKFCNHLFTFMSRLSFIHEKRTLELLH